MMLRYTIEMLDAENFMNERLGRELEDWLTARLTRREQIVLEMKNLESEKRDLDSEIRDLNKTYTLATGKSFSKIPENRPAADLVEELLREFGELHVDRMIELIAERQMLSEEQKIQKQSLVAMLVRYAQQNKRFRRTNRPNTFALIEE